ARDPTYARAIPQTSILQRAVGHLVLARQHLQHAYRLADTPGQQADLAQHLRWLDTVTTYVAELSRALDEQARDSLASVRDEGLLQHYRGGTKRAAGMTGRGRQASHARRMVGEQSEYLQAAHPGARSTRGHGDRVEQTSEAVLHVVAFALAGA